MLSYPSNTEGHSFCYLKVSSILANNELAQGVEITLTLGGGNVIAKDRQQSI